MFESVLHFGWNEEPFLERRRQQEMEDIEITIRKEAKIVPVSFGGIAGNLWQRWRSLRAACGLRLVRVFEGSIRSGLMTLSPVRFMGKPCCLVWFYHVSVQYAILSIPLSGWLEVLERSSFAACDWAFLAGIEMPRFLSILEMSRR
jgi:hypothetical protein